MIAVGVDTHKEQHLAVALDDLGQLLAEIASRPIWPATASSSTGSRGSTGKCWSASRAPAVTGQDYASTSRRRGSKCSRSSAAPPRAPHPQVRSPRRSAGLLACDGLSTPRGSGTRVALQMLLVAYRCVIGERSRLYNQLQALHVSAPGALRERIGPARNGVKLADRLTGMRTRPTASLQENTTLQVLRDIANRTRALDTQANSYTREIEELVGSMAPTLLDEPGVGPICTGKLLAFNPARFTARRHSHAPTAPHHNPPPPPRRSATDSAAEETAKSTLRSTQSRPPGQSTTPQAAPTCNAASPKERPNERPCAPSRDTSPATSTTSSPKHP